MSDLPDADLDVLSSNLSSGKLDPKTLSPEKRANLKAQLTAYQARKSGQPAPLQKNTAGQTIYPPGDIRPFTPPAHGTDPAGEAVHAAASGFRGEELRPDANIPEKVGHFVGKEGPGLAGMVAMGLAAPEAALPVGVEMAGNWGPGILRSAVGMAGGAGWQSAYQQLFGKSTKPLETADAARLVGAKALEGVATEVGGKLTEGGLRVLRQASLSQLEKLTSLPHAYVQRALARVATALPAMGESLESAEKFAMRHLQGVQDAVEKTYQEHGQGVDRALEAMHLKTGGRKLVDTDALAQQMRLRIDEKYRTSDPTVKVLAKEDIESIKKVLSTMESRTEKIPGTIIGKTGQMAERIVRPLKSFKDLVQIRRELDGMVKYSAEGLPTMKSDMGQQFARDLAAEYRRLISITADAQGDKSLLAANAKFSNTATNYDEWRPVFNTRTEGEPHMLARMKAVDRLMSSGGEGAAMFENMKMAFPKAAAHIDGMADSLVRRAFVKAQEKPADNFLRNLIKAVAPNKYNPAYAVRQMGQGTGAAAATGRAGGYLSSQALEALLAHIKPEERKK